MDFSYDNYGPPQAREKCYFKCKNPFLVHSEPFFRASGAFYRKKTKISYVNQTILRNRRKPQIIPRSDDSSDKNHGCVFLL